MKKFKIITAVAFLILAFRGVMLSQNPENITFEKYGSENIKLVKGLSQNWVYTILQDQYGYIWFGTWDGLNKYDGYNFTTYSVNDGLSDHTINDMLEDGNGNLWIATNKGLNKFDRTTQTFTEFTDIPSDTVSLYRDRINCLLLTDNHILWLGTGGGLVKFDISNDSMTGFLSTPQEYFSTRSNYILDICEGNYNNLLIGTTYGLIDFNKENGRSTRYYHVPGESSGLSNDNVRCIYREKSGNIWIGTRNGLNYYDTTTATVKHYFFDPDDPHSIGSNYVRTIYEDSRGNIWCGTESGGLNQYNRQQDNFIRYTHHSTDKNSLSNNRVYSIFEDNTGNLWIGTYNGVNKINKYQNKFRLYQQSEKQNGLQSNFIWSFDRDGSGHIWIGTSNGVNIMDPGKDSFSHMVHLPSNPNSPAADEIRTLAFDSLRNTIWLGIYGTGLDAYDLDTREMKHFFPQSNKNSLSNIYVNDILIDSEDFVWIATGRGLNRLDPDSNIFRQYNNRPNDPTSICNDIVICLFEDSKGSIWIGTDKGLSRFDRAKQSFENYFHEEDSPLNSNTIFYITEDYAGKIWVGTSGGGLVKLNSETGTYKILTMEDGLPNNIVYGILEDDEKNLWLSTNLGLVKFYPVGEKFVSYDVKDGIQSYEFNLGSCYKDLDGTMYFGGMNGFNVFYPPDIKINPNVPVVVITSFRKFNEKQPFELFDGDTIMLKYDDNFFSFEIAALDYTNPSKNRYKYILENFDNNWTVGDVSKRVAEYKKVTPGNYTFHALGSNNDGIWNEEGISISVIVTPPWYATWIFRLIAFLILISTIWLVIYRRMKTIRRKHEIDKKLLEIEKQKFELEQKALRLQMNPHFIFNSLNSIQSYILTHDMEMAVTYLGKFSQLMRLILNNSGNKFVAFKEELKALKHYLDLEKLRFDNKFEYNIHVEDNIDDDFIEIPPMIIQPYVENAIIHGILHKKTTGMIDIKFSIIDQTLHCSITDNGVGREKSEQIRKEAGIQRKSTGMYITKARLELLSNGKRDEYTVKVSDLKDAGGNATGTRVDLIIHYLDD